MSNPNSPAPPGGTVSPISSGSANNINANTNTTGDNSNNDNNNSVPNSNSSTTGSPSGAISGSGTISGSSGSTVANGSISALGRKGFSAQQLPYVVKRYKTEVQQAKLLGIDNEQGKQHAKNAEKIKQLLIEYQKANPELFYSAFSSGSSNSSASTSLNKSSSPITTSNNNNIGTPNTSSVNANNNNNNNTASPHVTNTSSIGSSSPMNVPSVSNPPSRPLSQVNSPSPSPLIHNVINNQASGRASPINTTVSGNIKNNNTNTISSNTNQTNVPSNNNSPTIQVINKDTKSSDTSAFATASSNAARNSSSQIGQRLSPSSLSDLMAKSKALLTKELEKYSRMKSTYTTLQQEITKLRDQLSAETLGNDVKIQLTDRHYSLVKDASAIRTNMLQASKTIKQLHEASMGIFPTGSNVSTNTIPSTSQGSANNNIQSDVSVNTANNNVTSTSSNTNVSTNNSVNTNKINNPNNKNLNNNNLNSNNNTNAAGSINANNKSSVINNNNSGFKNGSGVTINRSSSNNNSTNKTATNNSTNKTSNNSATISNSSKSTNVQNIPITNKNISQVKQAPNSQKVPSAKANSSSSTNANGASNVNQSNSKNAASQSDGKSNAVQTSSNAASNANNQGQTNTSSSSQAAAVVPVFPPYNNTQPIYSKSKMINYLKQLTYEEKLLLSKISANNKVIIDSDVENLINELVKEFLDSVIDFSSKLARHRSDTQLSIKDLKLNLERNWGITVNGGYELGSTASTMQEIRRSKKRTYAPTESYINKLRKVYNAPSDKNPEDQTKS